MAATATAKAKTGRARSKAQPAPDPHREAWIALCRAHAGVIGGLQETLTDAGLPPIAWYEVLDRVDEAPEEGIKMGDLAESLVISRGGLTKLVDRLVKAGLLKRAFCETDRRVSYAVITPSGREVIAEMRPIVLAELRTALTTSLSTREVAALRDALIKINNATCAA